MMRVVLLSLLLSLQFARGETEQTSTNYADFFHKYDHPAPLVAGPYEPEIVKVVGQILQRSHYLGKELDDDISSHFFDRFVDSLDPLHLYFLQSDIEEFERYRNRLDDQVLEEGQSLPARVIFRRFRERVDQQYDYARDLLLKEKFTFEGNDRYIVNRKDQPRPANLEEARALWRDRLRYEYLQEKLNIGRPAEIAALVREHMDATPEELKAALKDKVGPEKIEMILALVREQKEAKADGDALEKAVMVRLEEDNESEIVKMIARRYNRILRSINEYDGEDVLQIYLTALARVYDPHSDYMGRPALENFSIGMKLSLFGIGALLSSEEGYCKIVSLTPNGPAEQSNKLQPNDKIIGVAQGEGEIVDVVDMKLSKVVDLIRGEKGSEVRLTVIPADAPDPSVRKVVTLVRDEIKLEDQEAKAKMIEMPQSNGQAVRLGLIDLPSFYSSFELADDPTKGPSKSTTLDVARLIKKLVEEKVSGIILDLRRNGGGSLEEAINLTGLFIEEGPVVQVRDPSGRVMVDKDPDPNVFYDGPLIVLTSRFSASASEILAGALQDYGRAIIVGDSSTHGKGTVQSLLQLGPILRHRGLPEDVNPGALKITIRKFYRASGASTQLKGVTPDIVLPSINNHADVGEASLENALEWDTIRPARFDRLDWVDRHLKEVSQRSEERIAQNPDYAYVKEEIQRFEKKLEEKSISLNEADRLKEKAEADARFKARREALMERPPSPDHVFEISLKDVDHEGLPPEADATAPEKTGADAGQPAAEEEAEEEEEEEVPSVDIALEEAKRILRDLITLTKTTSPLTASSAASSKPAPPAGTVGAAVE